MTASPRRIAEMTKQSVLEALPHHGPGLTYQQIVDQIGMWSTATVRQAVRELGKEGLVTRSNSENERPRFIRNSGEHPRMTSPG